MVGEKHTQQRPIPPPRRMPAFWNCGPSCYDDVPSQPPPQPQRPHQRMRSIVDGIISPFVNCVQPPIQACVAPQWDRSSSGMRNMGNNHAAAAAESLRHRAAHQASASSPVLSPHHANLNLYSPHAGHVPPMPPHASHHHHPHHHSEQQRPLSPILPSTNIEKPHVHDILCGRGGGSSNRHAGNLHFRELITANKGIYPTLTKKQKMLFSRQIVEMIRSTEPPGRFLARDPGTGLYYDIGIPRSLEKTSQALREKSYAERMGKDMDENQTEEPIDCEGDMMVVEGSDKQAKGRSVQAPSVTVPEHLKNIYRLQSPSSRLHSPESVPDYASPPPPTMSRYVVQPPSHHHSGPPPLPYYQEPQKLPVMPPHSSVYRTPLAAETREHSPIPQQEQDWKRQRIQEPGHTSSSSESTQQLLSMQSRLSLEERVVAPPTRSSSNTGPYRPDTLVSPSGMVQGRSRTRTQQLDGLAALSTAAFLRLDEAD